MLPLDFLCTDGSVAYAVKNILLSENRVICVVYFRYGKQASGHCIDRLIYAATVCCMSSLFSHFFLFTTAFSNC